jgi:DtxR family transcriptional regulator, Mn-dependent transcriptional regulator
VMRKHRLAECLLVQVIGLPWELVHEEACRWEHVMSETVELRLLEVLGHPTVSPYGLPIPGLDELGETASRESAAESPLTTLDRVVIDPSKTVVVRRLAEPLQTDTALMSRLRRAGVQPGCAVTVSPSASGLLVGSGGEATEITSLVASHVFVSAH